jgi:hypothetical protein
MPQAGSSGSVEFPEEEIISLNSFNIAVIHCQSTSHSISASIVLVSREVLLAKYHSQLTIVTWTQPAAD